ncbi:HAD-IIA family hydrolase [Actinopolyspora mortivallis]|uniref:HAD-IIA family hydrolase n=1 Tax=Actinopolyspora mortivallis TaxID=33906 RepID=UPI0011B262E8|nr:HAD-IIA family hydrolase [Actinopolyspora mortivallis]
MSALGEGWVPPGSPAEHFDAFLVDLDGVVRLGDAPLPGAVETLARLRAAGKELRLLTNDPRPTRHELLRRLAELGVEFVLDEIVTCGWATAARLRAAGCESVFVLGSAGLTTELRHMGIAVVTSPSEPAEAVVVGCDENLTYSDLDEAVGRIRRGAWFVATNADTSFPGPTGPRPATGAVLAAVEAAADRGPHVVGKPHPPMFRAAVEGLSEGSQAVVVGDSPHSDVLGAHQQGLRAILVSTEPVDFPSRRDFRIPDARIADLSGLLDPEVVIRRWQHPEFSWPDTVRAGVAAVVFDEAGDVLLQRRADNGMWGLPSGHVEPAETVEEAVTREVFEETGLRVRVTGLIGVYSEPESQSFVYPSGRVSHFVTSCFRCRVVEGTPGAHGAETLEAAFFSPDALPTGLLPMHPRWLDDARVGRWAAHIR